MGKEINIAEILKDKPQGTKLYDLLYNVDVELDTISTTDTETVVWCTNETDNNTTCHRGYSEFGTVRGCPDGLQILLPSKSMRDWSKLAWKIGDLLTNECGFQCIFKEWASDDYTKFNGCYSNSRDGYEDVSNAETAKFEKLDDNIAHDYIKTIEERLGGKLNLETLEIEKQSEFKDGDILASPSSLFEGDYVFIFNGYDNQNYLGYYVAVDNDSDKLYFSDGNNWCYKGNDVRFATDEDKQRLFDALAKENKAWDAEKKQIVDLKPKWTPKPFDKIVAFEEMSKEWVCDMFSHYSKNYEDKEVIVTLGGCTYFKALPFNEETAKLIGTTKDME